MRIFKMKNDRENGRALVLDADGQTVGFATAANLRELQSQNANEDLRKRS